MFPQAIFDTFTSANLLEDQPRMVISHTLLDAYWKDKIAKLENIHIPAYVVASYTNPVHTHGTFAGFRTIPAKDKWLRVHNTNEWFDYYTPENVEDLRKFFDHYLNDIDNDWENTPKVRLSVLDPGHKDIVNRVEQEFPLARTKYRKLYLTADHQLTFDPSKEKSTVSYDSNGTDAHPVRRLSQGFPASLGPGKNVPMVTYGGLDQSNADVDRVTAPPPAIRANISSI